MPLTHLPLAPIACLLALASPVAAQEPCGADELSGTFQTPVPIGLGVTLSLEGDTLFVNDRFESLGSGSSGAIYVFERDPSTDTWAEIQRITAPMPVEQFGRLAVIEGDHAFVGSRVSTVGGVVGHLFVFERDPMTRMWSFTQEINASNAAGFPFDITAVGERMVATRSSEFPGIPAEVFVYTLDSSTGQFVQEDDFGPGTTASAGDYGQTLELCTDSVLAVSHPEKPFGTGQAAGCVEVYLRDSNGDWQMVQELRGSTPSVGGGYGGTFTHDGQQLFVRATPDLAQMPPFGGPAAGVDVYELNATGDQLTQSTRIDPGPGTALNTFTAVGREDSGVAWFLDGAQVGSGMFERSYRPWIEDTAQGTWQPGEPLLSAVSSSTTGLTAFEVNDGRIAYVRQSPFGSNEVELRLFVLDLDDACGATGARFCEPSTANSTGQMATVDVYAPTRTPGEGFSFVARGLPAGAEAILLASPDVGSSMPMGNVGELCLGAGVGRYPGVMLADSEGVFARHLSSTVFPSGGSAVPAMTGDTWSFQVWYRDTVAGGSNLTSASSVVFE